MRISAIRRQKRHPERVNVYVDGRFSFSLSEPAAIRAGLGTGLEITADQVERLVAEDTAWRARDAALRLLSHRARTLAEVRQRLFRKGFAADVVDRCVADLLAGGLLNDEEFATTFVRDRIRNRPKGRAALRSELVRRGIEPEAAEAAIRDVFEADSATELHLARQSVRKFRYRGGEDPRRTVRRLHGYLARRGFSAATIMEIVTEFTSAEPGVTDL